MKTLASRSFSKLALAIVLCFVVVSAPRAQTVTIANYLWFFPYVDPATISQGAATQALVSRLQVEVQKVLNLGQGLSIVQYDHHDRAHDEQYWIFVKPGRIITTLAMAYPYLTAAQKTAVRTYWQNELASATFQPWAGQLQPGNGTKRELFPVDRRTYGDSLYSNFPTYTPACPQMYGLWYLGWVLQGNWADLNAGQAAIRTWYTNIASTCNTYGGMGAHIAKARLEHIWGSGTNETTATNNLQAAMNNGLNFGNTENLAGSCTNGLWRHWYCTLQGGTLQPDSRKNGGGQYMGWVFLDIAPEVARYLSLETFSNPVNGPLVRHAAGKSRFPLWFLREADYDVSYTGVGANIEASGQSPELIGMIAPMERYAAGATSAQMLSYARSGPVSIGDSYFMELLVYAIESTGTQTLVDVRNGHP